MKYARQFVIILFVTFLGELLRFYLPFPIPAPVYGLLLMLAALIFKVIPLNQVEDVGDFMISIMPMMFIPAIVQLMVTWTSLKGIMIPVIFITLVTTIIVMVVAGKVTQQMIRLERGKKDE